MKPVTDTMIAELSAQAALAPRQRKNLNLHAQLEDPVQRLLNALEPGTYIRPHCHGVPPKWELFVILSGRAAVLTFDAHGEVIERVELDAAGANRIVEIPEAAWHTLVALAPQTVLIEIKRGPYQATSPAEFAHWAPPEGDAAVARFTQWLLHAQSGDHPPAY